MKCSPSDGATLAVPAQSAHRSLMGRLGPFVRGGVFASANSLLGDAAAQFIHNLVALDRGGAASDGFCNLAVPFGGHRGHQHN